MKNALLSIVLMLSLGAAIAQQNSQLGAVTPGIYKPGPQVGCNSKTLAQDIAKSCSQKFHKNEEAVNWASNSMSEAICQGKLADVGQRTVYTVIGNAKACPGNAPMPSVQGWNCSFTISRDYHVEVDYIYYLTCMG